MSIRWLSSLLVALSVLLTGARGAHAQGGDAVAVLYFDNNTGNRDFDVLQKGFADMLITDLASAPGVTVVEREKLQALLDEMALQKGDYFAPETALKVGKGLGARYAVTGSFAQASPRIRIDVRLVAIETGKVVVASSVTGKPEEIFELEQKLVRQFVEGMRKRYQQPAQPRTRVPDVSTLVDYGRAMDQVDRGEIEQAGASLGMVIKRAPSFGLARVRRDQLKARLGELREKRETTIQNAGAELGERARKHVAAHKIHELEKSAAKQYLAYRIAAGHAILSELPDHLGGIGIRVIRRGHDKKAREVMRAYYENQKALIADLEFYESRYGQRFSGQTVLDTSFELPPEDAARAVRAGFAIRGQTPLEERIELAQFVLIGRSLRPKEALHVAPPLGELEERYRRAGYRLIEESFLKAQAGGEQTRYFASRLLEIHADSLIERGDTEAGVERLQRILDLFPTDAGYQQTELRIKRELGLEYDNQVDRLERYRKGLAACADMDLRVGVDAAMSQRTFTLGIQAIQSVTDEMERACGKAAGLTASFWTMIYSTAAVTAAASQDCGLFEVFLKKYVAAGGTQSDAAAFRRTRSCK